jgi:hypothetical protein
VTTASLKEQYAICRREFLDLRSSMLVADFDIALGDIEFNLRCTNVLKTTGFRTVGDLMKAGPHRLFGLRNFGITSLRHVVSTIKQHLRDTPHRHSPLATHVFPGTMGLYDNSSTQEHSEEVNTGEQPETEFSSLQELLDARLLRLNERDAKVWRQYAGYKTECQTLEEIGAGLGVTRERVRQLFARAKKNMDRDGSLTSLVVKHLQDALAKENGLLSLNEISDRFSWFQVTTGTMSSVITEILSWTNPEGIHVWRNGSEAKLARWGQDRWKDAINEIDAFLKSLVDSMPTEEELESELIRILDEKQLASMSHPLLAHVRQKCHFTHHPGSDRRLAYYGRGIEGPIMTALAASETPLTMTELLTRLGVENTSNSVGNRIRTAVREAGGLLFDRSTYGLKKHIPFSEEDQQEIQDELIDLLQQYPPNTQVHSDQLCKLHAQRYPWRETELDMYLVTILLQSMQHTTGAVYHRRNVWSISTPGVAQDERIHINAAIEEVLEAAGRPLSYAELRQGVSNLRGLSRTFLPQPTGRVIRLRAGLYGLEDRDLQYTTRQVREGLDRLEQELDRSGTGLHVSEINSCLQGVPGMEDLFSHMGEIWLSLCQKDPRFHVARGNLLGLARWGGVRRLNLTEAVKYVLNEYDGPWTIQQLLDLLSQLVGRPLHRTTVSNYVSTRGLQFNASTGKWEKRNYSDLDLVDQELD